MVSGFKKAMIRMGLADSDEAYEQELLEEERQERPAAADVAAKPTASETAPEPVKPVESKPSGPRPVPDDDGDYRAPVTPIKRVVPSREESAEVHKLRDRKSTRLNSSHVAISYAVFCLHKKNNQPSNRGKRE